MNTTKPFPLADSSPGANESPQISPSAPRGTKNRSCIFIGCGVFVAIPMLLAVPLFWIYGTHTHHANRGSIWWSERGRKLIPPAAADITLRQDILDHYATYKITEAQLNNFLNRRFAEDGMTLDSFSDRTSASPELIGHEIGPLRWKVTKDTYIYSYPASNGGMHRYYHDAITGSTYQESAYW